MAKKRKTLKQKKQSAARRQQSSTFTYKSGSVKTNTKVKTKKKVTKPKFIEDDILVVDSQFIKQNLLKTLGLSVFFIICLVGIYFYLK